MKGFLLPIAIALTGNSFAQTPIPPQKPVLVMTEEGEVAGANDKIAVSVSCRIEPKSISPTIKIADMAMAGGKFDIDITIAAGLAKLIDEASQKLLAGEVFSGKAGIANVSVVEAKGQKTVSIKFDREGLSFSRDTLELDADNAASLARIIGRAKQISDWLTPKLTALQPH
jgi:hypothetical protein